MCPYEISPNDPPFLIPCGFPGISPSKNRKHGLDVVALTEDLRERGLLRGQVGTVVEVLAPDVFEVEFIDNAGHTYASLSLKADKLMPLHHQPVKVA